MTDFEQFDARLQYIRLEDPTARPDSAQMDFKGEPANGRPELSNGASDDVQRIVRTVPLRFAPEFSFPAYSYLTGRYAHPTADPAGHSYGHAAPAPKRPDEDHWQECREYLYGIDLFNHGYYWEAHEAWEGLWHACGRQGTLADFFKALIKLAAAGVKVREAKPEGARRHAQRALELLHRLLCQAGAAHAEHSPEKRRILGLSFDELMRAAESIVRQPPEIASSPAPVEIVFDFVLLPAEG